MTPEQRLDRVERVLARLAKLGREARQEFREKINILIDSQIKNEERFEAVNEQIKALAIAQVELTKSQKLTDRALRAFINSQRKRDNGNSSN